MTRKTEDTILSAKGKINTAFANGKVLLSCLWRINGICKESLQISKLIAEA
jgi:hypothetical protein